MRRKLLLAVSGILATWSTLWFAVPARPTGTIFQAWKTAYVHANSSNRRAAAFAAAADQAKCNVCHIGAPKKKVFNHYGFQLTKLIPRSDAKNQQKINDAFKTVAKLKIPNDPKSLTFGDRIRQGKLPGVKDK